MGRDKMDRYVWDRYVEISIHAPAWGATRNIVMLLTE